ncbi:hypothetical protein GCM10010230_25100 [Streptomyces narbonensis]|nr:hypothetical protein GCM10010230_25100 [Streptomyces narbonensis]
MAQVGAGYVQRLVRGAAGPTDARTGAEAGVLAEQRRAVVGRRANPAVAVRAGVFGTTAEAAVAPVETSPPAITNRAARQATMRRIELLLGRTVRPIPAP